MLESLRAAAVRSKMEFGDDELQQWVPLVVAGLKYANVLTLLLPAPHSPPVPDPRFSCSFFPTDCSSSDRALQSASVALWRATFGRAIFLVYPPELRPHLLQWAAPPLSLHLPGYSDASTQPASEVCCVRFGDVSLCGRRPWPGRTASRSRRPRTASPRRRPEAVSLLASARRPRSLSARRPLCVPSIVVSPQPPLN